MINRKPKKRFLHVLVRVAGIIIVCTIFTVWITGNTYIFKTLIYTYPDIDDLNIFDTRIINYSTPQPWSVSHVYNKMKLPAETDSELQKNQSVAFLVIKNDSIVYEQYWDNYLENSPVNSFSMAKSIVGILAGIAIRDGLITPDDFVGDYISEYKTGLNGKLKIKHLLTMCSGLNWDESYNSLFSKTTKAYYGTDLLRLVTNLKAIEEPGKIFRYMSCNTVLLTMIISKVSGMTISDYASKFLWYPLGATQTAFWSLDQNNGVEKSYCCFYSTARDFAKIGKLSMDSGMWNGQIIVPANYMLESISAIDCIDENGNNIDFYGYHWWITNIMDHTIFYARGILGQYLIVIPDEKIIIVRLGKVRGIKNNNNQYSDMIAYTQGVLEIFGTLK